MTNLISIQQLADLQVGYLAAVPRRLPLLPGENVELDLCTATHNLILEALYDYTQGFAKTIPRPSSAKDNLGSE